MKPAIIVHGGAWDIPRAEHEAHQAGCHVAARAGFEILAGGSSALDAVEAAVTVLEDDPAFDAGIGSHLNQAGVVQLDAGMMDGSTLQVGALAGVERLQNPIQVARLLLTSTHNMFVGEGAVEWAMRHGIAPIDPLRLIVAREADRFEQYRQRNRRAETASFPLPPSPRRPDGTVGAVAIDRAGNVVAGTSTGGTLYKPAGRVGDSPLPGCGYFADNQLAAVSATGHGESIIRVQLAHTAANLTATCSAQEAAAKAIRILADRVNGLGGLIMIDRHGQVGFAHNTPNLARAFMVEGMVEPEVGI